MNRHLQLGINLKNHVEIESAIDLLKSLLPESDSDKRMRDTASEFYNVTTATKGDLVALNTEPMKQELSHQIIQDLKKAKFNPPKFTFTKSEKARNRALTRKRDKYGHFLKDAKKK